MSAILEPRSRFIRHVVLKTTPVQAAEREKEHRERKPSERTPPPDEERAEEQRTGAEQSKERHRRPQPLGAENPQGHKRKQER